MFVTTTIMLMALTDACLPEMNQDATKLAEKADRILFPDGLEHDFGIVPRGLQVQHTFRVINMSGVPLRIMSLRRS